MSAKTIMHIAEEAGVSIATVSRAIRGKEGVGAETREKIIQIAERFHYSPNLQARGLASNKLDAIEIIIPFIRPADPRAGYTHTARRRI